MTKEAGMVGLYRVTFSDQGWCVVLGMGKADAIERARALYEPAEPLSDPYPIGAEKVESVMCKGTSTD